MAFATGCSRIALAASRLRAPGSTQGTLVYEPDLARVARNNEYFEDHSARLSGRSMTRLARGVLSNLDGVSLQSDLYKIVLRTSLGVTNSGRLNAGSEAYVCEVR